MILGNLKMLEIKHLEMLDKTGAKHPEDPSNSFEELEYGINILQQTRNGNY